MCSRLSISSFFVNKLQSDELDLSGVFLTYNPGLPQDGGGGGGGKSRPKTARSKSARPKTAKNK